MQRSEPKANEYVFKRAECTDVLWIRNIWTGESTSDEAIEANGCSFSYTSCKNVILEHFGAVDIEDIY